VSGFYSSSDWLKIRARQLARSPLCEACDPPAPATDVDHVKPISEGGAKRDPANLQSLCGTCHKGKTNTQRRGLTWTPSKLRGCDVEGYPLDPEHPWNLS